jgi:hypothetical protein
MPEGVGGITGASVYAVGTIWSLMPEGVGGITGASVYAGVKPMLIADATLTETKLDVSKLIAVYLRGEFDDSSGRRL